MVRTGLDHDLVDYVSCGTVIQEVKTSNVTREVCVCSLSNLRLAFSIEPAPHPTHTFVLLYDV